jgi:hypothetical protein
MEEEIRLTYQKPKELRALSSVDSNYATNKEDRQSVKWRDTYSGQYNNQLDVKNPSLSNAIIY